MMLQKSAGEELEFLANVAAQLAALLAFLKLMY